MRVPAATRPAESTGLVPPVLVLGYGNPGRRDDGLGPAFCAALAHRTLPGVTVLTAPQLVVEHAATVAAFATVVFVDAVLPDGEPFSWKPVSPGAGGVAFSSHTSCPGAVLGLARVLYGASTRGWTLGIRGARFRGFGDELSPAARTNLRTALAWVLPLLPASRPAPTPS